MDIDPNNGSEETLTFSALLAMLGRTSRQCIEDLMHRDPTCTEVASLRASLREGQRPNMARERNCRL